MKKLIIKIAIILSVISINPVMGQNDFTYGVYLDKGDATNLQMYDLVDELGMNTIVQYVDGNSSIQREMLKKYNIVAIKNDGPLDAVLHYSSGYYTKWEAEARGTKSGTGIKSAFGDTAFHKGINCWASGNETNNIGGTLLYGPHYRQDKKYKIIYYPNPDDPKLEYTLRINLAAKDLIPMQSQPTDPVCKISVVFSYKQDGIIKHKTLVSKTLYADYFPNDNFKQVEIKYTYPAEFQQYNEKMSGLNQSQLLNYDDTEHSTGIQFQVIWYGTKQLFVDKFEVYDNLIGEVLVDEPHFVRARVVDFVNTYNITDTINGWKNIKYFFNVNEPQTIDQYTPMKIVDEILTSINAPRGIAEFYPQYGGDRNGDNTIIKFVEMK